MSGVRIIIKHGSKELVDSIPSNVNLLKSMQALGLYIPAVCGEKGVCGKCKIQVLEGHLEATAADLLYFSKEDLDRGYRLACMAFPKEDLKISFEDSKEGSFSVLSSFDVNNFSTFASGKESGLAVGIDIGTTTVAFGLIDLKTGNIIGNHTSVNKQREYGADVITRIIRASNGDLNLLSTTIRTQISEGLDKVFHLYNKDKKELKKVAIAGNTTMLHLLLELKCDTLGVYPFTPVTLEKSSHKYSELFKGDFDCTVHILPGISTYVGADITAGLLLIDILEKEKPCFLLDIGTNGEMAVFDNGKIYCTSTAAGPAFEGGNILWGTGSVPGAISSVSCVDGAFQVKTIDNKPPFGICGSGVIDAVYQCLSGGFINKTGRFKPSIGNEGVSLAKTPAGEDIMFTQKDVRELQLGKSAIRSGIDILLSFAGISYEDIDELFLAGGFGYRINLESAMGVGLLPEEFANKITAIGNSSLGGAVRYLLDEKSEEKTNRIIQASEEHNLASDKDFNRLFIGNMNL